MIHFQIFPLTLFPPHRFTQPNMSIRLYHGLSVASRRLGKSATRKMATSTMNTQSDRAIPGDKGQPKWEGEAAPSQATEHHLQEHVLHAVRSTQEYVAFGNKHLGILHYQSLRGLCCL
jgi:hypothetical protein